MAVKIDMEMPKGCRTCKFCRYYHINHYHYCCLLSSDKGEHVVNWSYKNRDEFCPLQEVNNELPQNSACFDCAHTTTCLWLKKHGPCYSCGSKKVKE